MKCLHETPKDIAERMREVAGRVSSTADARIIRRYADWIEQHPDADEVKALL